jgi:hypothetical protein
MVRSPDTSASYQTVSFSGGSAETPVAVRISRDGGKAYVAAADGNLFTVDFASGSVASLSCGCAAASLDPMGPWNLFRITPVSASPLMVLDVSQPAPRVWFVPPGSAGNSAGGLQ